MRSFCYTEHLLHFCIKPPAYFTFVFSTFSFILFPFQFTYFLFALYSINILFEIFSYAHFFSFLLIHILLLVLLTFHTRSFWLSSVSTCFGWHHTAAVDCWDRFSLVCLEIFQALAQSFLTRVLSSGSHYEPFDARL